MTNSPVFVNGKYETPGIWNSRINKRIHALKSNVYDKVMVMRKLSLRNSSMVVRELKTRYSKFSNIIEFISKHYYENFDIRVNFRHLQFYFYGGNNRFC